MIQISPSGGEPSEDVIDLLQLVLGGMPETYIEVGKVVGALGARSFGIAIALGLTDKDGIIYLVGIVFAGIAIGATSLMAIGIWNLLETLF